MPKTIFENCYLYSLRNRCFLMKLGFVMVNYAERKARFTPYIDARNRSKVYGEPGVVYNDNIWLFAQDDEKAKQAFIDHEKTKIEELSQEIENKLAKIAWISTENID